MMWLVLGGPLAVVVAGVVTIVIAIRGADPALRHTPTATEVARGTREARGEAPAQQARNHAATPVAPASRAETPR